MRAGSSASADDPAESKTAGALALTKQAFRKNGDIWGNGTSRIANFLGFASSKWSAVDRDGRGIECP